MMANLQMLDLEHLVLIVLPPTHHMVLWHGIEPPPIKQVGINDTLIYGNDTTAQLGSTHTYTR
jgi:hypothetical protein